MPYDRDEARLRLEGIGVRMPFTVISIVGLILHELAANATKHGAWTTDAGQVMVDWSLNAAGDALEITWDESGGPAIDPSAIESGTGTAIVDRMLATAHGKVDRQWNESGLRAVIAVPVGTS
jgi:two-component sensor histidine kinase